MEVSELEDVLPHRYPMLLVDRVTGLVPGESLTAIKAITCNEPWYRGLPAGVPYARDYPAVLLVESWCQAAGVLAATTGDTAGNVTTGGVPLLGGLADVRLTGRARPGDVVEHRVRLVRRVGDGLIAEGESTVDGRVVVRIGRATMAVRSADGFATAAP